MRIVEAFLLILVALYLAGIALYIYNTSTAISSRVKTGEAEAPGLSNLPRNLSGETLYLTYRVDGYVDINGSIVDISNAMLSLVASYTKAQAINASGNTTIATNATETPYYMVSAAGDQAIIWALGRLISMTYNASQNISAAGSWNSSNISHIFGNLSLFSKTGEGQLAGGSGVTYIEYSLSTEDGVVIIRIIKDLGIPLECVANTKWGSFRLKLVSAS